MNNLDSISSEMNQRAGSSSRFFHHFRKLAFHAIQEGPITFIIITSIVGTNQEDDEAQIESLI